MSERDGRSGALAGKVALITGAGRGIGRAIALKLAAVGARVGLVGRTRTDLDEVAAAVAALGAEALRTVADVTRRPDVAAAVAAVREKWGRLDVLVNNAGVGYYAPIAALTGDQMDEMWAVNVKGTLHTCQEVLPAMLGGGGGDIVNMASVRGIEVAETSAGYSATKFGVMALSLGLEKEYGAKGIRVTALCPGGVRSDFAGQPATHKPTHWLTPDDVAEMVHYAVTAPRHVRVERLVAWPYAGATP